MASQGASARLASWEDLAGVVIRAAADGTGPGEGERGVGHYFTELAAAQGARVTAISRRGERLRGRQVRGNLVLTLGGRP